MLLEGTMDLIIIIIIIMCTNYGLFFPILAVWKDLIAIVTVWFDPEFWWWENERLLCFLGVQF